MLPCDLFVFLYNCRYVTVTNFHSVTCCTRLLAHDDCKLFPVLYEGKLLNNRNFIVNFYESTNTNCVLFFDTVPLLCNALGLPVHKLADAL